MGEKPGSGDRPGWFCQKEGSSLSSPTPIHTVRAMVLAQLPCWTVCREQPEQSRPWCFENPEAVPEGPPSRSSDPRSDREARGRPTAAAGRGAEPVLQLLPQAVVNADGLLQALAQVPDLTKVLLQQVGPCKERGGSRDPGHGWGHTYLKAMGEEEGPTPRERVTGAEVGGVLTTAGRACSARIT